MPPARAGRVRNALGSLVVLGVVAFVGLGLPALNRSMPAGRPVSTAEPYLVSEAVSVVPPPGASLDVSATRPGSDRGTALFVVDGVRLALVVTPFAGTLDEGAGRLRNKITKTAGFQIAGPTRSILTGQGVAGVRGRYTSPGRIGEYAVFVVRDVAVEVTVSGPEHRLLRLGPRLEESLGSIRIRGDP